MLRNNLQVNLTPLYLDYGGGMSNGYKGEKEENVNSQTSAGPLSSSREFNADHFKRGIFSVADFRDFSGVYRGENASHL